MMKIKLRKLSKRKMKSFEFNSIKYIFRKWLSQNMHRFNVKLIYQGKNRYKFDGLIEHIYLQMNFNILEATIVCNDKDESNYNYIPIEYIGCLKYDIQKGYYDADRTDDIFDYYKTLEELYIVNIFEHIVEYVNTNLIYSNCLVLSDYGGITDAKIINHNNYIKKDSIINVYNLYAHCNQGAIAFNK